MATVGRWGTFLALAVVVGAFGARWVLRSCRSDSPGRVRQVATVGLVGALILLPAALVRWVAQVMMMADPADPSPDWRALSMAVTGHTMWGKILMAHVALAATAAVGFAVARAGRRAGWWLAAVAAIGLCMTPGLSGHAAEAEHLRGVVVVADILHVMGGGLWLGTLGVLALMGFARRTETIESVTQTVNAFSPLALTSAAVIVVSGVVAAWAHLGTLSALWTSRYGLTLVIKLGVVGLVLAAGAVNWRVLTPRLAARDPAAQPTFARAVTTELSLGTIVFLVTAILVATPLPGME
jgi:putative copper export protein